MSAAPPSFTQKHFCYQEQASSEWTQCLQKDIIFGAITIKLLPTSNKSRVSTELQSLLAFQLRFGEAPFKNMFSYNCWHRTLFHNVTVETAEATSGSVCRRVSSTSGGCRSPKVSHLSRTLPVASVNPNNNILDRANTCSGLSSINPFVS